jgi:hypothetical protein
MRELSGGRDRGRLLVWGPGEEESIGCILNRLSDEL